jgi:hypothetical protein
MLRPQGCACTAIVLSCVLRAKTATGGGKTAGAVGSATECTCEHHMHPVQADLLLLNPMQGKLEEIYESFAPSAVDGSSSRSGAAKELQQLALRYSLPQELVEKVGAPPTMWTIIRWVRGCCCVCCCCCC